MVSGACVGVDSLAVCGHEPGDVCRVCAARKGAWRTPESTLHLLELLCGWPGAWLAQRTIRHKSVKTSFRIVFFMMVALNVAGVGYVVSRMVGGG